MTPLTIFDALSSLKLLAMVVLFVSLAILCNFLRYYEISFVYKSSSHRINCFESLLVSFFFTSIIIFSRKHSPQKGYKAVIPITRVRTIGSLSGVLSIKLYIICRPVNGNRPRSFEIVLALATIQAGASDIPT